MSINFGKECFANIRTPADIFNGDGIGAVGMAAFEWAAQRFSGSENASLAACLAPVVEPFRA